MEQISKDLTCLTQGDLASSKERPQFKPRVCKKSLGKQAMKNKGNPCGLLQPIAFARPRPTLYSRLRRVQLGLHVKPTRAPGKEVLAIFLGSANTHEHSPSPKLGSAVDYMPPLSYFGKAFEEGIAKQNASDIEQSDW